MSELEELELTELEELKSELLVRTSMASPCVKAGARAWAVDEVSRIEAVVKLKEQGK